MMFSKSKMLLVAICFATSSFFNSYAQKGPQRNWSSSRILHEINKLNTLGRVLYVAAHPDDENTRLISYLANNKGYETAYLSLTRGDGGQNLIGSEVREKLGVIRTQELLMARETDGDQQFFSRANDFGFSKTAEETFKTWNRQQVLSDIVWTIRKFKPDLIITRFSPTYTKTHGHHQASAILAQEAFSAAADPKQFLEQLTFVQPWQAEGLFWNTSTFFFQSEKFDTAGLYRMNVGSYLPLLGKSVGEISAESRSMHKSQGFGSSPGRGDVSELFVYLEGKKPAGRDITQLVNGSWNKIKGCENVPTIISKIIKEFDALHPEKSLTRLAVLYSQLLLQKNNYLVAAKLQILEDIMMQCAGIYGEALSNGEYWPVGDSVKVTLGSVVQNNIQAAIIAADLEVDGKIVVNVGNNISLKPNEFKTFNASAVLPSDTKITGPYWLEDSIGNGMYRVENQLMRGLPQNQHQAIVRVQFEIILQKEKISITRLLPVFNKITDPVKGELNSEVHIVPEAVVNPQEQLVVFTDNKPKELKINLKSFTNGADAKVRLQVPDGWKVSPTYKEVVLKAKGAEQMLSFMVKPAENAQSSVINIAVETEKNNFERSLETISYDHIPRQVLLPKSNVNVLRLNAITKSKLIGYIMGAGDKLPDILGQLGYNVELIALEQLYNIDLQKYDAIIAGIRAYNTVERLKYDNNRLLEYVKNGGTYIVQYNNNFNIVTDAIGPYELKLSRDRVTEEDAKVTLVNTNHSALNFPNKITKEDFKGWVQERGLYFPDKWANEYQPLLEMNDVGEKPTRGALLVADYGKGHFVYTGLSFFRELPAGVPGAYRLFINLIELGKAGK